MLPAVLLLFAATADTVPSRACLVRALRAEGYRVEVTGRDSSRVQLTRSLVGPDHRPDQLTQMARVILANGTPTPYAIDLASTMLSNTGRPGGPGEDARETERFRERLRRELDDAVTRCAREAT